MFTYPTTLFLSASFAWNIKLDNGPLFRFKFIHILTDYQGIQSVLFVMHTLHLDEKSK